MLLRAQQQTRATIQKKAKEGKEIEAAARRDLDVAMRRFSRQVADIDRDENRKWPLKNASAKSELVTYAYYVRTLKYYAPAIYHGQGLARYGRMGSD